MALEEDQITHIKNKVKELGSMERVKQLYRKDCAVDHYAIKYAKTIYKEE